MGDRCSVFVPQDSGIDCPCNQAAIATATDLQNRYAQKENRVCAEHLRFVNDFPAYFTVVLDDLWDGEPH